MDLIIANPFLHQKGGVEKVVLEIAKKFNPIIYSVVYKPERTFEELKEFDIRILPKRTLENAFFFLRGDERRYNAVSAGFRYYGYKIKEDYDVINSHGTPSEWIRNKNERLCWYCHSPNREAFDLYSWRMKRLPLLKRPINWALIQAYKFAEYRTVPKIEKICTNSEVTNKRIKKYLHREDAEVIHPGVDPKRYECESYEKFFFCPSRIVPEKRFEIAIEAFKLFSKKHKNWRLVIAGYAHNTEREQKYLEELKLISRRHNVEFKLNISEEEIRRLYATCSATLFCAINEDWGLIPIESMASSKPCISVNEGGPQYSIMNKNTGFLVEDYKEMAERMEYLAQDINTIENMGREGRKRVLAKYTWKIFLKELGKTFQQISSAKE